MSASTLWPLKHDPLDPYAEDPVATDVAHQAAQRRDPWGTLPRDGYERLLRAFEDRLADVLAGRVPASDPTLFQGARDLGLDGPMEPDPRAVEVADDWASVDELARIAANAYPDVGGDAADLLLGPFADALRRPEADPVLRSALAATTFRAPSSEEPSAYAKFCRRKPVPPPEERRRLRVLAHAPVGVWTLCSQIGDGWRLADRLGLVKRRVPVGPVRLIEPVSACGVTPAHGVTMAARVLPTPHGWVAVLPFLVPGQPPIRVLRTWLRIEVWRHRLEHARVSREQVLSERGHTVVRRLHEWAWSEGARPA